MARPRLNPNETAAEAYERHKAATLEKLNAKAAAGRDIGDIPPVANPDRKAAAEHSFKLFCESYFPQTFALGWSEDHLKVIDRIEISVLYGGLYAIAMPRGSGKTSLCECACMWATLYGHKSSSH